MKRIAMGVSYDGAAYHGWQRQDHPPHLPTIQYCVEQALSLVAAHSVEVVCAGRTDAKVHATQQVIHFDTDALRSETAWVLGANTHLPHDIRAEWAKEVDLKFHARFTAQSRSYRYMICNQHIKPAILRHYVTWIRRPLDVDLMQRAAQYLLGEHDFSSFRGAECQAKTAIRTLNNLSIRRMGHMIVIDVCANAFLLHMVRNIVGVLLPIGMELEPPEWAQQVLQACSRKAGGVTAAPTGLYLIEVSYPQQFDLPKNSQAPLFFL